MHKNSSVTPNCCSMGCGFWFAWYPMDPFSLATNSLPVCCTQQKATSPTGFCEEWLTVMKGSFCGTLCRWDNFITSPPGIFINAFIDTPLVLFVDTTNVCTHHHKSEYDVDLTANRSVLSREYQASWGGSIHPWYYLLTQRNACTHHYKKPVVDDHQFKEGHCMKRLYDKEFSDTMQDSTII